MNVEENTAERGFSGDVCDGAVYYPFPDEERPSELYTVTVNGREIPVYVCRVSAVPFNRHWEYEGPWHQRPLEQTEEAAFVSFGITEPVEVTVKAAKPFKEIDLRPRARGALRALDERTVSFTVNKSGQFSLEADGRHGNLHFFVDEPRTFEEERRLATYYFAPGIHQTGVIELKSGESVFIEAGAVVHGSIRAEDAENVGIYGYGILDGSRYDRAEDMQLGRGGLINLLRCRNVRIEGLILRDSNWWVITAFNGDGLRYRSLKAIGMWRYNSDGFDFVNCRNVVVSDSFLRTYDDSIVIKGIRLPELGLKEWNNENYLIENCTVWCDWGGALEIGAETVADEYVNIVYRNCDIIGVCLGAMRIHSGDRAFVHGVLYDNVRIEYTKYDLLPLFQHRDDEAYSGEPFNGQVSLNWMYCNVWTQDGILGNVSDVTYRDVQITADEGVALPPMSFEGADAEHGFRRIRIENLTFNGKPVPPYLVLGNEFVWDIRYIEGEAE